MLGVAYVDENKWKEFKDGNEEAWDPSSRAFGSPGFFSARRA